MLASTPFRSALAGLALSVLATSASAAPEIGKQAPDFTATTISGKAVKLSELRGKTVVLEWTNHECPYVMKHYGSGNMQSLQRDATGDGVVWLTLISSAKGEQGSVTKAEAEELTRSRKAAPSDIIFDEKGRIGRAYEARTTPHMFVINPEGKLVFMGGIDDKPTARTADIATAKNYVRAALDAVKAGQPVATPVARPYGCSIKYAPRES
jgi:alkyl hydroperoxide reductase subunit AhpC